MGSGLQVLLRVHVLRAAAGSAPGSARQPAGGRHVCAAPSARAGASALLLPADGGERLAVSDRLGAARLSRRRARLRERRCILRVRGAAVGGLVQSVACIRPLGRFAVRLDKGRPLCLRRPFHVRFSITTKTPNAASVFLYLQVLISFECLMVVAFPLRARHWFSLRRAVLATLVLYVPISALLSYTVTQDTTLVQSVTVRVCLHLFVPKTQLSRLSTPSARLLLALSHTARRPQLVSRATRTPESRFTR